jgi:hypothetical protein
MLHASGQTASAALDVELNKLFMIARSRQLPCEEWRDYRGLAERAMEKFMDTVRRELGLPAALSRHGRARLGQVDSRGVRCALPRANLRVRD